MSVISVGGRRYAANLCWLERFGRTARTAEWLQRHWLVHRGKRTGFAAWDASGCPEGLPALSLALMALIGGGRWVALLEGAATDGGALYALVRARDGAVLADGEELFYDRATALEACERFWSPGWALHATPGLSGALRSGGLEIVELDPDALGEAASRAGNAIVLARPAPARGVWRELGVAAVASLAIVGVWALTAAGWAWIERDALLEWIAKPVRTPMPSVPPFDPPDFTPYQPPAGPPRADR